VPRGYSTAGEQKKVLGKFAPKSAFPKGLLNQAPALNLGRKLPENHPITGHCPDACKKNCPPSLVAPQFVKDWAIVMRRCRGNYLSKFGLIMMMTF